MRFEGHVTGSQVSSLAERVRQVVDDRHPHRCLIDTTTVSGFSPDVRSPGRDFLNLLRELGVKHTVAAVPNPMVRMMGSAIALGVGFPLKLVNSVAEATRILERLAEDT